MRQLVRSVPAGVLSGVGQIRMRRESGGFDAGNVVAVWGFVLVLSAAIAFGTSNGSGAAR